MKHHIYFSPHMDDAIFSCGSLIHKQGREGEFVTIINFFAGVPTTPLQQLSDDTKKFITDSGFTELISMYNARREEDRNAINLVGKGRVRLLNLDFLESIYRKDNQNELMYKTFGDVFSFNVHTEDIPAATLKELINDIVSTSLGEKILYFPIPVWGHVDHMIIFEMGKQFLQEHSDTFFYEDIYTIDHSIEDFRKDQDKKIEPVKYIPVEEIDIIAHANGMDAYQSQIGRMIEYTKVDSLGMARILNGRNNSQSFRLWSYK